MSTLTCFRFYFYFFISWGRSFRSLVPMALHLWGLLVDCPCTQVGECWEHDNVTIVLESGSKAIYWSDQYSIVKEPGGVTHELQKLHDLKSKSLFKVSSQIL